MTKDEALIATFYDKPRLGHTQLDIEDRNSTAGNLKPEASREFVTTC